MNILILGGGGREHALAWAIRQNPKCDRLIVAPGNAGIAAIARCAALEIIDGAAVGPAGNLCLGGLHDLPHLRHGFGAGFGDSFVDKLGKLVVIQLLRLVHLEDRGLGELGLGGDVGEGGGAHQK